MNKSRLVATFVVALLIAAAAGFLVLKKLQQSATRAAASNYRVVVAARTLEIGTKLADTDLKLQDWSGTPPQGAFTDPQSAVGRAVLYPVVEGELILEPKLASVGAGAGLSATIPEGMRAVSIRVDEVVAVAGFVGPGSRVDVVLTGNPGTIGAQQLTKVILENVTVLAAGEKIQPDAQGRPQKVNVVTLLCTPEDGAKVILAANDGRIQLVLRNPTDKQESDKTPLVQRAALYGDAGSVRPVPAAAGTRKAPARKPVVEAAPPPPPPPPPPQVHTIEILRGERVSKVEIQLTSDESGERK